MGLFFCNAARPQTVHEYSSTISTAGFQIDAFDDHWHGKIIVRRKEEECQELP
jgi:hypothetical protein